jgi:hypothetical protein
MSRPGSSTSRLHRSPREAEGIDLRSVLLAAVLSAKVYQGPLGKCDVAAVSEIASPKGPTYSARLRCADPAQARKKTPANFIIRPGEANRISAGPGFDSLSAYQRCSGAPAAKQ